MSWGIKGLAQLSTRGKSVAECASQTSLLAVDVGGKPPAECDARLTELTQKRFRRLGRFTQLAMLGAAEAVYHAKVALTPARTGVFLGTGLGNISDLLPFSHAVFGDPGFHVSAIQFANSVGNAGAFYIAQALGLHGPVLAVSQDEVSFEAALMQATALLDAGDIDAALVGAVDVVMPNVRDHLARMGFAPDAPFNLSEGSAWWVLGKSDPAHDFATLEHVSMGHSPGESGVTAAKSYDVGMHYAKSGLFPTLFLQGCAPEEHLETTARTREGLTGLTRVRREGARS